MTLTMLSAVDFVDVLALVRTGEEADKLDAEAKQSLDALAKLPPLVAVSMVDPYIRGAFLVSEAWARGGWPRVARLYREPPQSTEQVLHPIEKLFDGPTRRSRSTCRPRHRWRRPRRASQPLNRCCKRRPASSTGVAISRPGAIPIRRAPPTDGAAIW